MQIRNWVSITASTLGIVFALNVSPASADINGFGDYSQWTINQADSAGVPTLPPNAVHMTNLANVQESRSVWYNTAQDISSFSASFTYQALNATNAVGFGACIVFQNDPDGIHALGASGGSCGYAGIDNSAAITLEVGNPSRTDLYTGGLFSGGSASAAPIDFRSGHLIDVSLSYNGSILHETLFDTVTSASSTFNYAVNIPLLVGGSSALVGFTASTTFGSSADQYIGNPQFSAVPTPGLLSILAAGSGMFRQRRRKAC